MSARRGSSAWQPPAPRSRPRHCSAGGRWPAAAAATIAIAGSAALATLVWAGHAGASEGLTGTIHRLADALHMIAAALWFGAIAAFLHPRNGIPEERLALTARSLDRFARTGTICVLVIVATGLINAQIIVGANNIGHAVASPYGQLLAIKLLFFILMLALAAANRWRLTPMLSSAVAKAIPPWLFAPCGAASRLRYRPPPRYSRWWRGWACSNLCRPEGRRKPQSIGGGAPGRSAVICSFQGHTAVQPPFPSNGIPRCPARIVQPKIGPKRGCNLIPAHHPALEVQNG